MTPRELKTLDFVIDQIGRVGVSPTMDEIAAHLGLVKSQAHKIVSSLVDAGKLRRRDRVKRGLEIVGAVDLRAASAEALRAELARRGMTLGALDRDRPASMARGTAHCAADGCQMGVKRGHLMCYRHWSVLPNTLQHGLLDAHARRDLPTFSGLLVKARDIAAEVRR